MISITPLYSARDHRYKGVYPRGKRWEAVAWSPDGKPVYLGYYDEMEPAAHAVATYYHSVFGADWPRMLKERRRRDWRIRRIVRYPFMANLHRGPKVTVYRAEVRLKNGTWHRVTLDNVISAVGTDVWNEKLSEWRTTAAALVAIRMYKMLHYLAASVT